MHKSGQATKSGQHAGGQKIAYTVAEFIDAAGIGRTRVYQEIRAGRLRSVKVGARTLIPVEDARAWLDSLRNEEAADAA